MLLEVFKNPYNYIIKLLLYIRLYKENLFAPLKMGYLKNLTLSGKKWYFCGDCVRKIVSESGK